MRYIIRMDLVWRILSNGYIPIIPILVWNLIFTSRLPPAYDPKLYNDTGPLFIIIGENVFRAIIFLMPLFFKIKLKSSSGKTGFITFVLGVVIYFSSWLMLIYAPDSEWSISAYGFLAPAYTPLIWLIGLSLMADAYYFNLAYSKWHFIIPSITFSIFHVAHSAYVYHINY